MTKAKDKKPIARLTCFCGERAAVYQNTRDYLYTRCPSCQCVPPVKCNQDNSAARQLYVWQVMEPLPKVVIKRPRNVPKAAGAPGRGQLEEPVVLDAAPAPAAIAAAPAAPADAPAPAGTAPAETPEKAEENAGIADPATPEPAQVSAPEPAPIADAPAAPGKRTATGLIWGGLALLSIMVAGVVALAGGNTTTPGESAP